jgi:hypothetical protein
MDPTQCLKNIRKLLKELSDADAREDLELASSLGLDLAEHVEALDEWMMKGGFLPQQWGDARATLPAEK